jgi:hypothetical protein
MGTRGLGGGKWLASFTFTLPLNYLRCFLFSFLFSPRSLFVVSLYHQLAKNNQIPPKKIKTKKLPTSITVSILTFVTVPGESVRPRVDIRGVLNSDADNPPC